KDTYDNAVPSGTSSIVRALLRLSAYGHDDELFARAERTLRGVSVAAMESPMGFGYLVCALDLYANGPTELDVVAEADDAGAAVLIAEARRTYVPDLIVRRSAPGAKPERPQRDGRATAYVCRGRACSAPVTTLEELRGALTER